MKKLSSTFSNISLLRSKIFSQIEKNGLSEPCYKEVLDYAIDEFESNGFGKDYYGYHNIEHLLEVPFCTLLVASAKQSPILTHEDLKHLFVSALFHDFDPDKINDRPGEENVLKYLVKDSTFKELITKAAIDFEFIKILILRTTYPWSGELKQSAEKAIQKCFEASEIIKNNPEKQEHYLWLGWLLSVIDRMASYAIGNFSKAMHMAKMNSYALAWHPTVLVHYSVIYFEELIGKELEMSKVVLRCLPKDIQKNFMNNVQKFMKLRQQEIQVQSYFIYNNLKLVPKIESGKIKKNKEFVNILHSIYRVLPRPLRFKEENFEQVLNDSDTILNTLRLGNTNGSIIGFARGGPLENYNLPPEIHDVNFGKKNTIFLEPIALKMGYWGFGGEDAMRHLFIRQVHALNYEHLTSFVFRDGIERRVKSMEKAKIVAKFDPERWDYYRIRL